MLTQKEKDIISRHVNKDKYDIEKLLEYLSRSEVVGNEIFNYIIKEANKNDDAETEWFGISELKDKVYYTPVSRQSFIRRIPFYFYEQKDKKDLKLGKLTLLVGLSKDNVDLEKLYLDLETLHYDYELEVTTIFNYVISQTGLTKCIDVFNQWVDYNKIITTSKLSLSRTPKCFIADYNKALVKAGRKPIIYDVDSDVAYWSDCFLRKNNELILSGKFPVENGKPILEWIGVELSNIGEVEFEHNEYFDGLLKIELLPNSVVKVRNAYDDSGAWWQIYAGPQMMFFDHTIFKREREKLKYTQQYIADAIQTSVRTYQKWENGETIPDGNNIIRLMNILDIDSIQLLIKYLEE